MLSDVEQSVKRRHGRNSKYILAKMEQAHCAAWQPKKRISRADMERVRLLHKEMPHKYNYEKLGFIFGVSRGAIGKILKSKWVPSPNIERRQAQQKNRTDVMGQVGAGQQHVLPIDMGSSSNLAPPPQAAVTLHARPTRSLESGLEGGATRHLLALPEPQRPSNPHGTIRRSRKQFRRDKQARALATASGAVYCAAKSDPICSPMQAAEGVSAAPSKNRHRNRPVLTAPDDGDGDGDDDGGEFGKHRPAQEEATRRRSARASRAGFTMRNRRRGSAK
jgi:hypothetical protein